MTMADVTVKEARGVIADAFRADPGFRDTYVANVAMLIYDDQCAETESRGTKPPTNLRTKEGCNAVADRIVKLVFE